MTYDIAILGGGPAGVTAALRARELGVRVALIEKSHMGGTCTNDGCVPTRVLAKTARLLRDAHQFSEYGLNLTAPPTVDFEAVMRRTQQVVYEVHEKKQLLAHLSEVGVDVYPNAGQTYFTSPRELTAEDGTNIQADRFIICVGGSARRLDFPGAEYALTHSDIWTLKSLPAAAAIIGSGATGAQLASILEAFGVDVTLMDVAPHILPGEDADVSRIMSQQFRQNGMSIITGIQSCDRIDKLDGQYRLTYTMNDATHTLDVGAVLLAVGWPGNISGLQLDRAGVETERNYIKVNDYLQTTARHIYAAGDITGKMMLVQSAGAQARTAVENALMGSEIAAQHRLVPHGGFTDPEYGSVGMTEAKASEIYGEVLVAKVPFADLDRAVIDDRKAGFCKLVIDRSTQQVIGAHVVGEQAVEIVQMITAGMAGGLTVEQYANLELAYPTYAAIVGLAARQLLRDLDNIAIAPEWRALQGPRIAEWERTDDQ